MTDREEMLEARVEELEQRVEQLEARLAPSRPEDSPPRPTAIPTVKKSKGESKSPSFVHLVDKIGIALLLLGVAFLLKYSYDQGWLSETFRVVLGGLTGVGLLAAGLHQRNDNAKLSAVLHGGSVATFYGTIFAAFELYSLIPANAALALTVGVTMLGFTLAVRQDEPALACIATVGGFATPFLMEGGPAAIPLAVFASIVILGTSAIYLFKGWEPLLVTMGVGGFAVVGVAMDVAGAGFGENVVVYLTLGLATLSTGVLPAVRAQMRDTEFGEVEQFMTALGFLVPIFLLPLGDDSQVFEVVCASILAVAALAASQVGKSAATFNLIGSVLLAVVLGLVMSVDAPALGILGCAVVFGWLAARSQTGGAGFATLCLLALAIGGAWSFAMLLEESGELFGTSSARLLIFSVATLVALGFGMQTRPFRWGFFYLAMFAGMATWASQLAGMSGGDAIVTGTWGTAAVAMLVAGFVRAHGAQQALGIIAVLLTAGKLLFIDLDSVDTIVRVGLFMAMGATLLFVSYLVPRWEKGDDSATADPTTEDAATEDAVTEDAAAAGDAAASSSPQ